MHIRKKQLTAFFVERFKAVTPEDLQDKFLTVLLIPSEITFPIAVLLEEGFLERALQSELVISPFAERFKAAILCKSERYNFTVLYHSFKNCKSVSSLLSEEGFSQGFYERSWPLLFFRAL